MKSDVASYKKELVLNIDNAQTPPGKFYIQCKELQYIDNNHIESYEYCEILNPEKINLDPEVHPLILIPVFYKPTLLC